MFRRAFLVVLVLPLYFMPFASQAIEVAPRITDREIVERLTRLEEGQKALAQRFDDVNRRFDDVNRRFDDVNQRITDLTQIMLAMFGSLIALIIALFGYIAWDRRTMFRPLKERLEQVELKVERIIEDEPGPRGRHQRSASPLRASNDVPDHVTTGAVRA